MQHDEPLHGVQRRQRLYGNVGVPDDDEPLLCLVGGERRRVRQVHEQRGLHDGYPRGPGVQHDLGRLRQELHARFAVRCDRVVQ